MFIAFIVLKRRQLLQRVVDDVVAVVMFPPLFTAALGFTAQLQATHGQAL